MYKSQARSANCCTESAERWDVFSWYSRVCLTKKLSRQNAAWQKLFPVIWISYHTSTWSLRWKASSSSKSFLVRMQPSGSAITWPASFASALSPSRSSSPSNSSELCVELFHGSSAIVSAITFFIVMILCQKYLNFVSYSCIYEEFSNKFLIKE